MKRINVKLPYIFWTKEETNLIIIDRGQEDSERLQEK